MVNIGDPVVYVDWEKQPHAALVLQVHDKDDKPSIDLLHINSLKHYDICVGDVFQKSAVPHKIKHTTGDHYWIELTPAALDTVSEINKNYLALNQLSQ